MRITKDNIGEFINGKSMYCSNKDITHIEYIPDGITNLFCSNNKLTELPKLPESLEYLYCRINNLPYHITIENLKEHNTLLKRKEILEKIRLCH
tara:strand:+ start:184 stop:465 length:282 start_codon:yes stop_codon:yes gene_type:complete